MITLILTDVVSEDLSLRNMVSNIFNSSVFQKKEDVLIDFTGIKSISRAFAHEFLTRKQKLDCKVMEINLPSEIKKMFEIVENPKIKSELIKASAPQEIGTTQ